MNTKAIPKHYSLPSRLLHWVTAVAVLALFAVGLWMVDLTYYSEWYKTAPHWHKSLGILLALATLIRLGWKWWSGAPAVEGKAYEIFIAKWVHSFLYVLLFVMFFSGYLISTADGRAIAVFNWFEVPSLGQLFDNQPDIAGEVHYYSAMILMVLALIHGLAALKHHYVDKDNTLRKMLGERK